MKRSSTTGMVYLLTLFVSSFCTGPVVSGVVSMLPLVEEVGLLVLLVVVGLMVVEELEVEVEDATEEDDGLPAQGSLVSAK